MTQHDTDVQCPVCKTGLIVAEIELVATESLMLIPIGPGSKNYYRRRVTSFHCSYCQVLFNYPPGKPGATYELLRQFREE